MKFRIIASILTAIISLVSLSAVDLAISHTAVDGWTLNLDSTNLYRGAGSDYADFFTSPEGIDLLSVTNADNTLWTIYVSKSSNNSGENTTEISVKITDEGSGTGELSYAEGFLPLTTEYTELCSGTGNRSTIKLQYAVSGISILTTDFLDQEADIFFLIN